jgi:hypothetical protein
MDINLIQLFGRLFDSHCRPPFWFSFLTSFLVHIFPLRHGVGSNVAFWVHPCLHCKYTELDTHMPLCCVSFGSLARVGYPASPRLDTLPFFCYYAVMPFPSMKEINDSCTSIRFA